MLCAGTTAFSAESGWSPSLPGWTYEFPRDHGSHPSFKTEWWYFTGNVETDDGVEFGYQLTFFRQGVIPSDREAAGSAFGTRDVKFAHFAVTAITGRDFRHFQHLSRGAFGEAGFDDGRRLAWIKNWTCELTGPHSFRLRASEGDIAIDLALESAKPPVFHGRDGVSQKAEGAGRASHYYSLTRLKTQGTITWKGQPHQVGGLTWFDHEWATNQLTSEQTGWDWFSLQFDDGTDLMVFQIRTKSGTRDPFSSGTFVAADGRSEKIENADFELVPVSQWKSPKTGANYPVAWRLRIPSLELDLDITARLDNQELAAEPFAYWEGAISAKGRRAGNPVSAKGYLEMTGYAGRIIGLQDR